jgi:hypothetical protein
MVSLNNDKYNNHNNLQTNLEYEENIIPRRLKFTDTVNNKLDFTNKKVNLYFL